MRSPSSRRSLRPCRLRSLSGLSGPPRCSVMRGSPISRSSSGRSPLPKPRGPPSRSPRPAWISRSRSQSTSERPARLLCRLRRRRGHDCSSDQVRCGGLLAAGGQLPSGGVFTRPAHDATRVGDHASVVEDEDRHLGGTAEAGDLGAISLACQAMPRDRAIALYRPDLVFVSGPIKRQGCPAAEVTGLPERLLLGRTCRGSRS